MNENDIIDVWVTKWALTEGIFKRRARKCTTDGMVDALTGSGHHIYYLHGNEWHESPEAAIERAEHMRAKAIAASERKLAKLRAIRWEIVGGDVVYGKDGAK